jgi:sugar phosphate isomerase/epimerase
MNNKKKISISTGGFKNLTGLQAAKFLSNNKIDCIELSGGKYSKDQLKSLIQLKKKIRLRVHNYFPPPQIPFVLNLASNNKKILNRSISHIKNSIKLVKKLDGEYYSFHAGFRVDPNFKLLGQNFKKIDMMDREKCLKNFSQQVLKISKFAKKHNVKILIENNVCSKKNFERFGDNPFLLTNYKEIKKFFKKMPKNVRLLIDVAHLKVSTKTEKFDPIKSLTQMNKFAGGYHFSDNDGKTDSNKPIKNNSWFFPYLKKNLNYYSAEIYNENPRKLKQQIKILNEKLSFKK